MSRTFSQQFSFARATAIPRTACRRIKRISFSRNQSSDKLIIFSILERLEARLDPRSSILARIENRGSSLDTRLAKDCQLTFGRYYSYTGTTRTAREAIITENDCLKV